MFLFVIALAAGIYLHDAMRGDAALTWSATTILAIVVLPKLLIIAAYALRTRLTLRHLASGNAGRLMRRQRQAESLARVALLASYAADLYVGWLTLIRQRLFDVVLVDELLLMLPPLLCMVAVWAIYYPIDRRLRGASLIADLDAGRPVAPVWSRSEFLLAQVRHQIAFILVPLCMLLAIEETLNFYGPRGVTWLGVDATAVLRFVGVACVFVISPLIIRHLWDAVSLPAGSLHDRLTSMCRMHRVRYRELLLWRTFGGMTNAAVMGLFPPLRYILLTDALLENMSEAQVEAVMAHEIAHIHHRHLFWLLVAAMGTIGLLELLAVKVIMPVLDLSPTAMATVDMPPSPAGPSIEQQLLGASSWDMAMMTFVLVGWVLVFGWVSRRFERQADTFAVQHLSTRLSMQREMRGRADEARDPATTHVSGEPLIDADAAQIMIDALQRVADLNHIPVRARSWRHGSIAWRQEYLRSLVGQPAEALPIDRMVTGIKIATAVAGVTTIVWFSLVGLS